MADESNASDKRSSSFATTHWSLVLAAGETRNPDSQSALAALCKSYWYPVYALVRYMGNDADSARDLTQGFFVHLLEKHALKVASPDRGRFRNFLKTSLRNYLDHEREKSQAKMRGGGVSILNIDFDTAESQYLVEPVHRETPETLFEKQWARALLGRALDSLAEEMQGEENRIRFQRLSPFLTEEMTGVSYRQVAAELQMSEGAVKGAVHRIRKRFGKLLREEVGQTVSVPGEVDDEIRYLFSVITS
jgi:RNA polymerase sigma-70 factor (ECF subfamily)